MDLAFYYFYTMNSAALPHGVRSRKRSDPMDLAFYTMSSAALPHGVRSRKRSRGSGVLYLNTMSSVRWSATKMRKWRRDPHDDILYKREKCRSQVLLPHDMRNGLCTRRSTTPRRVKRDSRGDAKKEEREQGMGGGAGRCRYSTLNSAQRRVVLL